MCAVVRRSVPSEIVAFIEQGFPIIIANAEKTTSAKHGELKALLGLLDQLDPALEPEAPKERNALLIAIGKIRAHVAGWDSNGPGNQPYVQTVINAQGLESDAVRLIHDVLRHCKDVHTPDTVARLEFLDDREYEAMLREDMFSAQVALDGHQYKVATIMSGAVVEAILLFALKRIPSAKVANAIRVCRFRLAPGESLDEATLGQLLRLAKETELFGVKTLDALKIATEYRNLIHPGKQQRQQAAYAASTAYSEFAAMHHLIEECERQPRPWARFTDFDAMRSEDP